MFRLAKKKNKVDDDVLGAEISAGFSVNTADERFFPALRNSANYGIDPTSSEFKPTEGMNKILREQRKQRQLQEEKMETDLRQADGKNNPAELPEDGKRKLSKLDDVGPLVDRLKKKYKASTTK